MPLLTPRRLIAAAAVLAAAAACSDPSTAPNATSARAPGGPRADAANPDVSPADPQSPDEPGAGDPSMVRHVMPAHALAAHGGLYTGSVSGGRIYYWGGTVLKAATNVVAVYWAGAPIYTGGPAAGSTGAGTGDGSLVGLFLRSLGGSPYFNINTAYYGGSNTTANHVKNVVNYTRFWANNASVPANGATVTDAQMIAMLQSGFDTGKLTYDASTLYIVFSAGTVNLGGGFGTQYCAYHTHGTVKISGVSKTVLYSAMPYNAASGGCLAQTTGPNAATDPGVDPEVSVLAHEIEETTTDAMGNAWYDLRGYENADKCAWTWGTTQTATNGAAYNLSLGGRQWLVQRNWNVATNGCAMSY